MGDKYILHYFDAQGRAEQIRILLTMAGVPFEDHRFSYETFLKFIKPKMPFAQIPLLEVNDVELCQSLAIVRYIAQKYGFACNSLLEDARADMIAYSIADMRMKFKYCTEIFEHDPVQRAVNQKEYGEVILPQWLSYFEEVLKQNNGGNGYFVGDSLTWVDVTFMTYMEPGPYVKFAQVKFDLSAYPKLTALCSRVRSNPLVARWYDISPKTEF